MTGNSTEVRLRAEDQEENDPCALTVSVTSDIQGEVLAPTEFCELTPGSGGSAALVNLSSALVDLALTTGNHVLTAQITDSGGLVGQDTIAVSVVEVGDPLSPSCQNAPIITGLSPSTGQSFPAGQVAFEVGITDPDLPADSLSLVVTSDVDGQVFSQSGLGAGTIGFSANLTTAGPHLLTARVTDSCPQTTSQSSLITIEGGDGTVDPPPPDPEECAEVFAGSPDGDGDGVVDPCDLCPEIPNASQEDSDGDGLGDACDADPFDPSVPPPGGEGGGGACAGGQVCTPEDLSCLLHGDATLHPTCNEADFGEDGEGVPDYADGGDMDIPGWFEKFAEELVFEVLVGDPDALNTVIAILEATNAPDHVLDAAGRDRIREMIADILDTLAPGYAQIIAATLELEGTDPDPDGLEPMTMPKSDRRLGSSSCGAVGERASGVPFVVAAIGLLGFLRGRRRMMS